MDNVYFGNVPGGSSGGVFQNDNEWRNYYLFGLIPSSDSEVEWAGTQLANSGGLTNVEIKTQKSFLNGLAEFGIGLIPIFGFFRPFLFNFRSVEVSGARR